MTLQDIYYHNVTATVQTLEEGLVVPASSVIKITDYFSHPDLMSSILVSNNLNTGSAVLSLDGSTLLSQSESLSVLSSALTLNSSTSLPSGGSEGALLIKDGLEDFQATWSTVSAVLGNLHVPGQLRLYENPSNGSAHVGFVAPADLNSDQIWTLPSSDGDVGEILQTDGAGNLSFNPIVLSALSITTVDALTTSVTNIWENLLANNETWVIHHILFELENVSSISGNLFLQVGIASGESDILAGTRLRGFNTEDEIYTIPLTGNVRKVKPGEIVKLNISTAFSGTAADLKIHLYGYKLP